MGYCVVHGCTTTDGCGRSLHGFPKCKTLRLAWIPAVRRQKFLPTKFSRICSLHFSPSAFTIDPELAKQCGYKKMTLRPDDVPTEHLPSSAVDLKWPKSVERSGLAVAKHRNYEVNKTGTHQNVSLGAHLIFPIMHTVTPLYNAPRYNAISGITR